MAEVAQSSCIPHTTPSAGAPSAHKQSQFYCVGNHEQPRRGESLFASTEQPVYRLSPLYPEGKVLIKREQ